MLNKEAIRVDVAPKDGNFGFDVPLLETMFPSGTLDPSVERVYGKVVSGVDFHLYTLHTFFIVLPF